jgi:hypothetical protein
VLLERQVIRWLGGLLPVACAVLLQAGAGPAQAARDAVGCRKKITSTAVTYLDMRRWALLKCVDRLLQCELPHEMAGGDVANCRKRAKDLCTEVLGPATDSRLNRLVQRFEDKATIYCSDIDFFETVLAGVPGGLGYGDDPDCGSSADLASLVNCLRQRLDASVDTSFGTFCPRAGILLDNAGLGAGIPNLPRPPTLDVIVSATEPGSGTLVPPGTISPEAGTAVRFAGDAVSLPCGSEPTGRLTVTVLPLGTACSEAGLPQQQLELEEPYTTTATVGPFTSDVTYCLRLSDEQCDHEVSGTIDVP